MTKSTRRREGHRARERVKRKVKRKKEKIKKMGAHGREREINKKIDSIVLQCNLKNESTL